MKIPIENEFGEYLLIKDGIIHWLATVVVKAKMLMPASMRVISFIILLAVGVQFRKCGNRSIAQL